MATGIPAIFAGFAGLASIANETFNFPVRWTTQLATGYDVWRPENNNSTFFGKFVCSVV